MKLRLQFSSNGSTWYDIGDINFNDKKEYSLTPILVENQSAINEIAAYKVKCVATVDTLNANFVTTTDEYYFRLYSLESSGDFIPLGGSKIKWNLNYDMAISKVSTKYLTISLEFIIPKTDFSSYITYY